jgi:hypothetical protein
MNIADFLKAIGETPPPRGYKLADSYIYRDETGDIIGAVVRYDGEGRKTYRPFRLNGVGLKSEAFDAPRPLYGLDQLADRPGRQVLVVEGEKAADAAAKIFPDFVVVTSPGGSQVALKADWAPLAGRIVTIWPDNDDAGAKYALDVLSQIQGAKFVMVPSTFPEAWDLADDIPPGADLHSLLKRAARISANTAQKVRRKRKDITEALRQAVMAAATAARLGVIRKIRALKGKTTDNGATPAEADEAATKVQRLMHDHDIDQLEIENDVDGAAPEDDFEPIIGHELLDSVEAFLRRFVAYPSDHAVVAHVLWIFHAHLIDCWTTTPRLHFCSAEKMSGKTRALEITALLVPNPVLAVNVSPAYLCRKVGDEQNRPTILYDEVDNLFSSKVDGVSDVRALLTAGHRKGAAVGRCVHHGSVIHTEEIPAYSAVALAGIGDIPDTIASRSIHINMRRRAPSENVEPYRPRLHEQAGHDLRWKIQIFAEDIAADAGKGKSNGADIPFDERVELFMGAGLGLTRAEAEADQEVDATITRARKEK